MFALSLVIIAIVAAVLLGYLTLSVNINVGTFKWSRVFGNLPVARKPRAKKAKAVAA